MFSTTAATSGMAEAHAAEKPLSGQAVRYKSHLPGHSFQLSWAGRRVGPILYALRPLWVHSSAVPCQYRVEIFKKENNLFYKRYRNSYYYEVILTHTFKSFQPLGDLFFNS